MLFSELFSDRIVSTTCPHRCVFWHAAANGCEQLGVIGSDGALYMTGNNQSASLGFGHTVSVGKLTRVGGELDGAYCISRSLSCKHTVLLAYRTPTAR